MKPILLVSTAILLFVFCFLLLGCTGGAPELPAAPQGIGTIPTPPMAGAEKIGMPAATTPANEAEPEAASQQSALNGQPPETNEPPAAPPPAPAQVKTSEEIDAEILAKVQRGTPDADFEVMKWDRQRAQFGTTLMADNHIAGKPRIIEVNMLGEIVWEYGIPPEWSQYTNPGFDVELLPSNNILFVLPGKGVFEVNREGEIVWSYLNSKVSHDADRLENGNTLIAYGNNDGKDDIQAREIDAAGKTVWSWQAKSAFDKTPYSSISDEGWTHANSVSRLANGNTLISLRNFNLLAEVSPSGTLVRTIENPEFYYQHDPSVQDDGTILMVNHATPNEAMKINWDGNIVWRYAINDRAAWPSRDANTLPNGNILITGTELLIEITPEGEAVWVFRIKDAQFTKQTAPALGFYKAERIVESEEATAPAASETGASTASNSAGDPTSASFNPTSFGSPNAKAVSEHGACCNHPYYHKVYRAFSNDGLAWEKENKLIKEHASVPDIFERDDGTQILYYVDGIYDTTDCVVSKDGGAFSSGGCTIYGFTEEKAWDPNVVKTDDGYYRLYFFAPDMARSENRIMSAVSRDGIIWLMEDGARFSYPGILDPSVIKIGDRWLMYTWYPEGEKSVIVVAESNDGLSFAKKSELRLGGGVMDVAMLDSGQYAIYFCENGIQEMTSSDGLSWSGKMAAVSPAGEKIVCDPSVAKTGGTWVMYYKTQ